DRRAHARTARLMETEARISREAWGRSIDASNLARAEEGGGDYKDAGGRSQKAEAVHRGTKADEETQMIEFERQQGPAEGPAQSNAPEEAGSSS
ncbi:hypothetical protein Tco_0463503, partial [Tanacetum coccineum]